MDKDSFLAKITEIGACENNDERLVMLAEVSEEVSKIYDNDETNKNTIQELNNTITKNNEDMKKLQEYNMSLFLRIGEKKNPKDVQKGSTGEEPEPNKRKFEDLFKDDE